MYAMHYAQSKTEVSASIKPGYRNSSIYPTNSTVKKKTKQNKKKTFILEFDKGTATCSATLLFSSHAAVALVSSHLWQFIAGSERVSGLWMLYKCNICEQLEKSYERLQ